MNGEIPFSIPDIFSERIVDVGCIVKVHFLNDPDGYTESYKLVRRLRDGETENGIQEVPIDTPLGRALLGEGDNGVGSEISFFIKDGSQEIEVRVMIVEVY